ncbi:MAG: hypothetical protein IPO09_02490 [Anaeromyxobacter sp.]|nr:hypothetical protein [Anaeromyxobacter sp.]MBL0275450.1 hypothetical protein [Anaeromyxobacter sp.]
MDPAALPPRPPARLTSPRGGRVRRLAARVARAGWGGGPAEPWLADHPWRREGALDESGREARQALLGGGLLVGVGSAVGAAILPGAPGGLALLPALVVGVFLAVGFWLLWRGVRAVLRRARHGVAELRFARLPFFLGEPLEVTLVRDGATARLEGLTARLTCLEERWGEPVGRPHDPAGPPGGRRLERVERWSATRAVAGGGGARLPIRFDLPAPGPGVLGTALSEVLPRYWELELWADLPGPDFHAVFLVPVYQRPGPAGP